VDRRQVRLVRSGWREQDVMTLSDDSAKPMLTIRYVAQDDTFAVIDTAQGGKVVQGGFKTSSDAQRFAEEMYAERGVITPTEPQT
jgi:hypothetical protein